MSIQYTGRLQGTVRNHTSESLSATWNKAYLVLPCSADAPKSGYVEEFRNEEEAYPTVVFCHGSSGVNAQIKIFARWLADAQRVAVVVPDSMQTADRLTYSSPVSPEDYEVIHRMRLEELEHAMTKIKKEPWFDGRAVLAGTSEGGVAAARYQAQKDMVREIGRMIFSWSCEDNYHVRSHRTHIPKDLPVINVMSAKDKFFSQANSYLGNPKAWGFAAEALAEHTQAEIILIPGAPHTLINLPQTRDAVSAFLIRVFRS